MNEAKMLPVMREQFAAQVVRWEYSTEPIWSYGEWLRKENTEADILPGPEGAFHICGYDGNDRPIMEKSFEMADSGKPAKEPWLEEFFVHGTDVLEVSRFVRGELEDVYRMVFRDRLLIEEFAIQRGFFSHARIHYQGRKKQLQQSLSETGRVTFEIVFGPHGEQTYFRVRRDGTHFQLGQALPKGMTVKSLKETIRRRLLAIVPQVVASAGIKEPIYCVALAYDGEGDDALPPVIGIGLESERQKWLIEKDGKQRIWNPAEFQHYEKPHTQIEDEALEDACDYWNGKLAESASFTPAIKLLVEVATELNRVPWPAEVQRASGFVAYAVDFELGSLRKNLKASLPAERLTALKASKLI